MTIAGVVFIGIGFVIAGIAARRYTGMEWAPFALLVYHTAMAIAYATASYETEADSYEYFLTAQYASFSLGTQSVPWLTSVLIGHLGTSYLDLFLFFQLFGFAGIMLFGDALLRISHGRPRESAARIVTLAVLFLPGLNYWSTALGKDPLAVLSIGLVLNALTRPKTAVIMLLWGCFVMLAIRPHIFILLLPAIGLAVVIASSRPLIERLTVAIASITGVILALPFVFRYISLDEVSRVRIVANLNTRLEANSVGGGVIDLSGTPFWGKFFAYFYRPLFVDTDGILGLIASIENLALLLVSMSGIAAVMRSSARKQYFDSMFVKFAIIYGVGGGILVSLTLSNLGIALRQKYMFLMPILLLAVFAIAHNQSRSSRSRGPGRRSDSRR